jgi:hypothetical protein
MMNDKDILGGTGTLVTEPSSKNQYDGVEALTALYNGVRGESIVSARPLRLRVEIFKR